VYPIFYPVNEKFVKEQGTKFGLEANQYLHIAILVLEVIGNGAAIVVSQYLGSKRFMEASKISALAVTLNLIVGLVISAGFLLFSKHMMLAM
ncbi:MATE family efflux transporter, partial [Bacillus thuringiensis]|nr:MATE family efflux transporter [Bacillus thuringiensis]